MQLCHAIHINNRVRLSPEDLKSRILPNDPGIGFLLTNRVVRMVWRKIAVISDFGARIDAN